ncbi:MAG: endonuclease domain-containing protein [Propionibacteriales bacterium]|nr:endonuclease domain-containing protein [Propionibacteriales bacterium]
MFRPAAPRPPLERPTAEDTDRGVFRRSRLVAALGEVEVKSLVRRGELRRVRHGWYADATADPAVERAVRLGGQLSCLSALRLHGVWAVGSALHVARRRQPREALSGLVLHSVPALAWASAVAPVIEALAQVIRHHDPETALMSCESAVNLGLLGAVEVDTLLARAQQWKQPILQRFDPLAESGSETRLRLFFRGRGAPVRAQVHLTPSIRSDLLVGCSWVIEADSRQHHGSPADRMRDLERDLTLARLGYRVTRLSYDQIFCTWQDTRRVLSGILRTRQHRRLPIPVDMVGELPKFPASRPW